MRLAVITAAVSAIALPAPASAEVVRMRASGALTGFEYGAAGASAIFAVAPLGTAYSLEFGYDTDAQPMWGGANYAAYGVLPVNAVFTLGGYSVSLGQMNVTVGDIGMGMGDQFQLFGNADYSPAARLAGHQLIDLSLRLTDPTSTAFQAPALPAGFDLSAFAQRTVRARFAFGTGGETALTLSVASISPLQTAVPEPGTWALMIAGFGLVGAVARRRASGPVMVA